MKISHRKRFHFLCNPLQKPSMKAAKYQFTFLPNETGKQVNE